MIKVYQIKDNGFLGEVREIDPAEGVDLGWTYLAPPGDGSYKWVDCQWVEAQEPKPLPEPAAAPLSIDSVTMLPPPVFDIPTQEGAGVSEEAVSEGEGIPAGGDEAISGYTV